MRTLCGVVDRIRLGVTVLSINLSHLHLHVLRARAEVAVAGASRLCQICSTCSECVVGNTLSVPDVHFRPAIEYLKGSRRAN
jgi:hypothetical protein